MVPAGDYPARLIGIARFTNTHQQARLKLTYRIDSGPHAGAVLIQTAAISASPYGRLSEVLQGLLGRDPTQTELQDGPGSDQIGTRCRITTHVASKPTGAKYAAVQKATRLKSTARDPA